MNLWLMKGAPAEKLTGGLTSFGHSYVLVNEQKHTINSPANGIPEPGEFTQDVTSGALAFYEVILLHTQKAVSPYTLLIQVRKLPNQKKIIAHFSR